MFRYLCFVFLLFLAPFPAWAESGVSSRVASFAPLDRERPHEVHEEEDDEEREDRGRNREHDRDEADEDEDGDGRERGKDRDRGRKREEGGEDRDHDEDDREEERGRRGHGYEEQEDAYDEGYAYYGRVQAIRPEVVVGRRVLVGDLALLRFLAPGMRVEVEGRVEDGRIRVKAIHVHHPKNWAFYEGPTPEGWSRVWYAGGRPWRVQAADPGPRVRLLACYEGGWRGLPEPLRPTLRPPRSGLWLMEGLLWQGQVRWTRQTRLGACHE